MLRTRLRKKYRVFHRVSYSTSPEKKTKSQAFWCWKKGHKDSSKGCDDGYYTVLARFFFMKDTLAEDVSIIMFYCIKNKYVFFLSGLVLSKYSGGGVDYGKKKRSRQCNVKESKILKLNRGNFSLHLKLNIKKTYCSY